MTITDNLQTLINTKSDIKSAIESKGVTVTGGLSTYADAIREIEGTGGGSMGSVIPDGTKFANSTWSVCPQFDTSNVTNMSQMFYGCTNLRYVPQLDTSNVTKMINMFYKCYNLTTIPQLDTSKVTDMSSTFYQCELLTTIPQFDTSKVTNMNSMFCYCSSLTTIPQLDTSSVTNMGNMFYDCYNLTTIPQLDTSSVTNMYRTFWNCCNELTTIPQLDTSKVISVGGMFDYCSSLKSIPLLDFGNVSQMGTGDNDGGLLYSCHSLEYLGGFKNLGMREDLTGIIRLDSSSKLERESLLNVFNNLYDRAAHGYSVRTIYINEELRDKLSFEDIAIATAKGWSVKQL